VRTDEHRAALNDPEVKARKSAALKKFYEDPEARARNSAAQNDPEVKARKSAAKKKFYEDPEARARQSAALKKFYEDPEARARNSAALNDPEVKARKSAALKKFYEDPEARERQSAALKKFYEDPEARERKSAALKKFYEDPEVKLKQKEAHVGGFCIQNITYDERKKYCELWNPNLWRRIDACQGNRSIISGKTKEENGGRALSRHHVYWQEKACCVWDEDAHGYYAMIDIGTKSKPEMYKHYINGSPNKFVLLTHEEHGMIRGNKKLGTTKLTWIKTLEDLIETKLDGKCFYTEEEYAELSLGGRFTGEGRKVGHGKLTGEQIAIVKKATGFEPDINFS